jgi:AraC-like DNA-binding protein
LTSTIKHNLRNIFVETIFLMGLFNVYTDLIAMFLSVIIMLRGSWFNNANLFLGGYFLVTAYIPLVFCFGYTGDSLFWTALLVGNTIPFYFLLGPLSFFYVRSVLTDQSKLSKTDYLHFLLFFIQVLLMLPYLFTSWDHKLAVAQMIQDGDTRQLSLNLLIIPDLVNSFLGMLHLLFYLVLIAYTCWRNKKTNEIKSFNNLSLKFIERWLLLFFLLVVIFLVNTLFVSLSNMAVPSRSEFLANFPGFIKYTGIMHLIILGGLLSFPEIMYGIPRVRAIVVPQDAEPVPEIEEINQENQQLPRKIMLNPNGLQFPDIERQIENLVHHTKSYLEPDFTIYKLSVEVGIPVHHLRYYFNKSGLSFTNFKNRLRINYAITILSSSERNRYSIEGIGQQAGFTSNASFFTEFKKETGQTPAEYARSQKDIA